jgi:hypothetical protein
VRVGRQISAYACGFGHAVELQEAATEAALGCGQQVLSDGRGAVRNCAQRRQIGAVGLGLVHERKDHGWHEEGVIDALFVDEREHARGRDLFQYDKARALGQARQPDVRARDVKQRHGVENLVLRFIAKSVDLACEIEEGAIIGVRDQDAFGMSGRAARVELKRVVVGSRSEEGIVGARVVAPLRVIG